MKREELTDQSVCVTCFSGAVLSLTMGESGDSCYSGGLDGSVRCWKMPDLNVDPYDNYGPPSSPRRCPSVRLSSCVV